MTETVLLHTRSPRSILEQVAKRVTGTIIITEPYHGNLAGPICWLVPGETNKTFDTWWNFTPEFFRQFLAAMGFSRSTVTRNFHRYCHAPRLPVHHSVERRALDGGIAPPCARSGPHGRVDQQVASTHHQSGRIPARFLPGVPLRHGGRHIEAPAKKANAD
jgi:hypothetical protein